MFRRREPVPFAFLAEADRFRSNVAPPPRERASAGQMAGRWLLGLTGLLSLILGILMLGSPSVGAMALLWAIGVYAVIYGAMLFAFGLRLISAERSKERLEGPTATAS